MKYYFFDSSAIVKLYVPEVGSDKVKEFFKDVSTMNLLSILSWAEVPSAFFRKTREIPSTITFKEAENCLIKFLSDFYNKFYRIDLYDWHFTEVIRLIKNYSLKSADAIILSQAISLIKQGADLTIITSDKNIFEIALQEEIRIINPEDEK